MDMSGRGDKQVHRAGSRLPTGSGNVRRELTVAVGHSIVYGKRIEPSLQSIQPREPDDPNLKWRCYQHFELERRDADDTDGQLSREGLTSSATSTLVPSSSR